MLGFRTHGMRQLERSITLPGAPWPEMLRSANEDITYKYTIDEKRQQFTTKLQDGHEYSCIAVYEGS